MEIVPSVETLRELLEKETRERGHVYAMFGCEHWLPICVGIAKRVGFEEYIAHWADPDYGAHCRCVLEDEAPAIYVQEDCPRCQK